MARDQECQQQAQLKKTFQNSSHCAWKSSADCQEHSRPSEHWQRNRKILTEELDMRKVCAKMVPKKLTEEKKQSLNLQRPFGEARWHFGSCYHRWWNMGLPIRPWNEVVKCTMEDCQFPTTKKIPSVQIKSQNNVADLFFILWLFIMNLYQLLTIWKYWQGCVKKLDGNDPNFLPTTHGSCITTMHLLTWHCLWGSFSY